MKFSMHAIQSQINEILWKIKLRLIHRLFRVLKSIFKDLNHMVSLLCVGARHMDYFIYAFDGFMSKNGWILFSLTCYQ